MPCAAGVVRVFATSLEGLAQRLFLIVIDRFDSVSGRGVDRPTWAVDQLAEATGRASARRSPRTAFGAGSTTGEFHSQAAHWCTTDARGERDAGLAVDETPSQT